MPKRTHVHQLDLFKDHARLCVIDSKAADWAADQVLLIWMRPTCCIHGDDRSWRSSRSLGKGEKPGPLRQALVVTGGKQAGKSSARKQQAHRIVAMAIEGGPVPSHMPVHHKCANPKCINPEHLQVVHPHENNAEMLERNFYLQRIADLEAQLAALEDEGAA